MTWHMDNAYEKPRMNSKKTIAANLKSLMGFHRERGLPLRTLQAIEDATKLIGHKVGRSTVDRMLKGERTAEVDNLEAVAKVFDVEVWQLFITSFEPDNLPVLLSPSPEERALYVRVREAALAFNGAVLHKDATQQGEQWLNKTAHKRRTSDK
jgi:transcriptional regulator with XRE-family HTH domain